MLRINSIKNGDWEAVRSAFQQLQSNVLGTLTSPTYAGLTLTGLTASRLIWADSNKALASKDLVDLVAGTANEINVSDDGSGGITVGIVDPLIVGKGGTGASTLTDHSLLVGSGTDAITAIGVAGNGEIPIGSAGADPVLAVITGTANQITVTNGAGSITLATPQDIHTSATPTFSGVIISDSGNIGSASDNDAITITSGGLVGINDTTPTARFDVNGTIRATDYTAPADGVGIELGYTEGNSYVTSYNRGGSSWLPLVLRGSSINLHLSGTTKAELDTDGFTIKTGFIIEHNGAQFGMSGVSAASVDIANCAARSTNKGVVFQFEPNGTANESFFRMCNAPSGANYSFCDYNVIGANAAISPRDIGSPGTSVANLYIGGTTFHSSWTAIYIDSTDTYIGDGGDTDYVGIDGSGHITFNGDARFYPRVLNQSAEPGAGTGATQCDSGELVVWTDTDDSKCYLCYNHGGTVKTVELV